MVLVRVKAMFIIMAEKVYHHCLITSLLLDRTPLSYVFIILIGYFLFLLSFFSNIIELPLNTSFVLLFSHFTYNFSGCQLFIFCNFKILCCIAIGMYPSKHGYRNFNIWKEFARKLTLTNVQLIRPLRLKGMNVHT